jgi:hypothetical protein
MEQTARLFNCSYCKCQITICTRCDRGNIYCKQCALSARKKSLLAAAKRYQNSLKGKLNNAKRQQTYRQRQQQKVTHQGSQALPSNALLPLELGVSAVAATTCTTQRTSICDFCGNYGKYN